MGFIRPATPGFIVTLAATVLLAVVSFCVPYFKSIYFLKASIEVGEFAGNITFGTLGYCLELPNGTTCSKPSVGYELDINGLVDLPVQIPQVAVKWLTYALVLHLVALAGAGLSAVFGLLAHVREMSMTCCSTFVSGFAAVVAMFAFIFDLVLFFVAKSRINSVGSAQIGNAIWLTLAAWLLLFFSGCFYAFGRCCILSRPRAPAKSGGWMNKDTEGGPDKNYSEQVRLDAVKAEADRKARQKQASETGLPAFYESQPLTGHVDGDQVYVDNDHERDSHTHIAGAAAPMAGRTQGYANGYVQGVPGSRTIDEYYAGPSQPQTPASNTYPPHREPSGYAPSTYSTNTRLNSPRPQQPMPQDSYGASPYAAYNNAGATPAQPSPTLAVPGQYPQEREYGHTAGGSSYFTAMGHNQQASAYSQYDPYTAQSPYDAYASQPQPQPQSHYAEPSSYHDPYGASTPYGGAVQPNPYINHSTSSPSPAQHDRAYTIGGDGYGNNSVPPLPDHNSPGGYGYGQPTLTQSPPPIDTNMGYSQPAVRSPVGGPRPQPSSSPEDAPPGYEPGTSGITGNWGKR